MGTRDVFKTLLDLLPYSGPFFPLLATLFFRRASHQHFRRNVWALIILTGVQAMSFLLVVLGETADKPDYVYLFFIPFGLSALMFVVASVYAVAECIYLWSLIRSHHAA
jgi:FtsH-binding integral membrane protein